MCRNITFDVWYHIEHIFPRPVYEKHPRIFSRWYWYCDDTDIRWKLSTRGIYIITTVSTPYVSKPHRFRFSFIEIQAVRVRVWTFFLCLTRPATTSFTRTSGISIFRMKNRAGRWAYWCRCVRYVDKTNGHMRRQQTQKNRNRFLFGMILQLWLQELTRAAGW